ncbi:hypothetical protein A5734_06615 [Mycolicibacterium fortuitum]|nr:hypothetical protein A5734_06615 [Mycolicibacterium fortuitum]
MQLGQITRPIRVGKLHKVVMAVLCDEMMVSAVNRLRTLESASERQGLLEHRRLAFLSQFAMNLVHRLF